MPAKSKSQQKFMGMVRAAQKGDLKNPSPEVKKAAKSMKKKDVKDFAGTKHKKLPEKVRKEKKISESHTPYEETQEGYQYLDEIYTELMNEHILDRDHNVNLLDKHYELIYDCIIDDISAEACAEKIMNIENGIEETVQNVVFNESVTRAKYVNEKIEHPYGQHDGYSPRFWTYQEGDEVLFHLDGQNSGWEEEDPESAEIAFAHDEEIATITSQATATETGNKDWEYYDIVFSDGKELFAVSGFHLEEV